MSKSISDPRWFDSDADAGITEYFHYNPDDDSFIIETQQDIEPFREWNLAMFNDAPTRWGEWSHVARIPAVVMMQLAKQGIVNAAGTILDQERFKKWVNDRDNRLWRTKPGVV